MRGFVRKDYCFFIGPQAKLKDLPTEEIKRAIAYLKGDLPSAGGGLEKLANRCVYALRLSDAKRIIYIRDGLNVYFVDYLPTHRYDDSMWCKTNPAELISLKDRTTFERLELEVDIMAYDAPAMPKMSEELLWTGRQHVALSEEQKTVLELAEGGEFPLVVRGAAGTGKTLIAQQFMLSSKDCHITYVTKTSSLVEYFRNLLRGMSTEDAAVPSRFAVMTYADFMEKKTKPADDVSTAVAESRIYIVDEAQAFSEEEICAVLEVAGRNVLVLYGDHQGDAPLLVKIKKYFFDKHAELKVPIHTLQSHYRCPLDVIEFANAVIGEKLKLTGGAADKGSERIALPGHDKDRSPRSIQFIPLIKGQDSESQIDVSLRVSAANRVVVTKHEYLDEAKLIFPDLAVYDIKQVGGLEFDHVILFKCFELNAELMKKLPHEKLAAQVAKEGARSKSGKGDKSFEYPLNLLVIAITRACKTLTVCDSFNSHKDFFRNVQVFLLEQNAKGALAVYELKDSLEDWLECLRNAISVSDEIQIKKASESIVNKIDAQFTAYESSDFMMVSDEEISSAYDFFQTVLSLPTCLDGALRTMQARFSVMVQHWLEMPHMQEMVLNLILERSDAGRLELKRILFLEGLIQNEKKSLFSLLPRCQRALDYLKDAHADKEHSAVSGDSTSSSPEEINVSYQYEDRDVTAILQARLLQLGLPDVELMAAVDILGMRQHLTQRLHEYKAAPKPGENWVLIPCNIGQLHWVGLRFKFDGAVCLEAEFIDSLTGTTVPRTLELQLQALFPEKSFVRKEGLIQGDVTSCGAYMIENLLNIERAGAGAGVEAQTAVSAVAIRRLHIEALARYSEVDDISSREQAARQVFHRNFESRQARNMPTFDSQVVFKGFKERKRRSEKEMEVLFRIAALFLSEKCRDLTGQIQGLVDVFLDPSSADVSNAFDRLRSFLSINQKILDPSIFIYLFGQSLTEMPEPLKTYSWMMEYNDFKDLFMLIGLHLEKDAKPEPQPGPPEALPKPERTLKAKKAKNAKKVEEAQKELSWNLLDLVCSALPAQAPTKKRAKGKVAKKVTISPELKERLEDLVCFLKEQKEIPGKYRKRFDKFFLKIFAYDSADCDEINSLKGELVKLMVHAIISDEELLPPSDPIMQGLMTFYNKNKSNSGAADSIVSIDKLQQIERNRAAISIMLPEEKTRLLHALCGSREVIDHMVKVKMLLADPHVDVNQAMTDGATPLHTASQIGHLPVVKMLLAAPHVDVNQAMEDGATPLCYASQTGHLLVVKALLEAGAEVNQAITDGATPLSYASQTGHLSVVKALLEAGAKVNQARENGSTPLHIASQIGHLAVVNALLEAGAEVNQAKEDGTTPLSYASKFGHLSVVNALLKRKAGVNQAAQNGLTPLHTASHEGHHDVVKMLLKAKAKVNQAMEWGATPLFIASVFGHLPVVKALLKAKAKVNQAMEGGATPLFIASEFGHLPVVNALLEAEAKVNQAKEDGTTPLHIASHEGHHDVVEMLLEAGAKVNQAPESIVGKVVYGILGAFFPQSESIDGEETFPGMFC